MNVKKKKRHPLVTFDESKHILTNEDWHPTIDGKVVVRLIGWDNGEWRVCVWGGDDFGMEIDLKSRHEAKQIFSRIVNLTTMAEMRRMGLGPA
jgi:hypothetical protein